MRSPHNFSLRKQTFDDTKYGGGTTLKPSGMKIHRTKRRYPNLISVLLCKLYPLLWRCHINWGYCQSTSYEAQAILTFWVSLRRCVEPNKV